MEQIISKLLQKYERGNMSRRQLVQSLTMTAAAAFGLTAEPASAATSPGLKGVSVNHLHFAVHDYKKIRDFYVNLFGMKVFGDNKPEKPNHCHLQCGDTFLTIDGRSRPAYSVDSQNHAPARVQHIAIGIHDFDKKKVDAVVESHGIHGKWITTTANATEYTMYDPEGFQVQIVSSDNIPT